MRMRLRLGGVTFGVRVGAVIWARCKVKVRGRVQVMAAQSIFIVGRCRA